MKTTATARIQLSLLGFAALVLLTATGAQSLTYQVSFGEACKPAAPGCSGLPGDECQVINAKVGVDMEHNIQGVDLSGEPVTWAFEGSSDCEPLADGHGLDCLGVQVLLPSSADCSSTDEVCVKGTPSTPGLFGSAKFFLRGETASIHDCDPFAVPPSPPPGQAALQAFEGFELIVTESYDLVFVLDRSGSMSWDARPGVVRWTDLTTGVNGLTSMIEASSCAPDSRFGMTLFATQAFDTSTPGFQYANPAFHDNLIDIDDSLDTTVSLELAAQSPSGWTAMGDGLEKGVTSLSDNVPPVEPPPPNRKRVMMLFTDGEQNQVPEVTLDGTMIGASPVNPGGDGEFIVHTVGVGQPVHPYRTTLQNLANAHGGEYRETNVIAADIVGALDSILRPLLDGCSLQMVASYTGQLSEPVTLPPFDLNRRVDPLLIKLSVPAPRLQTAGVFLPGVTVKRGVTDVTGEFELRPVGDNILLVSSGVETPPQEGSYTITLAQHHAGAALDYRVAVFADDKRLDMASGVSPAAPRVEQPIGVSMSLGWLGAPVIGATVEALILEPGDDVGDLLARNDLTVDVDVDTDAGSPGLQKFIDLLQNDADFLAQILPQEQQLTLADQGDGTYTGSFDPGDVSGTYQVIYRVSADDPNAFGKIQRTAQRSVYVRFGDVDMAASATSVKVDDKVTVISFRPITTSGRFVGPAAAGAFSITGAGVSVDRIEDLQDGTYRIFLSGDPTTEISVSLLNEEVYSGPAYSFGSEADSAGLPRWLLWLIILIILLILIWILKKVFK